MILIVLPLQKKTKLIQIKEETSMIFILAISQLLYQMDKAQGIVSFVQYFTYILQMD
jgi:hypothetical protein